MFDSARNSCQSIRLSIFLFLIHDVGTSIEDFIQITVSFPFIVVDSIFDSKVQVHLAFSSGQVRSSTELYRSAARAARCSTIAHRR